MTTKLKTALQSMAACFLAVFLGTTVANAQAPQPVIVPPNATMQKFANMSRVPAQAADTHLTKLQSPYERNMAPFIDKWMKANNISAPTALTALNSKARSAGPGRNAVNGSVSGAATGAVNFPGFVATPYQFLADGDGFQAINGVTGDFNGDGKPDVAVIRTDGVIDVILSPGPGIASQKLISSNTVGGELGIVQVVAADMNADGKTDLVGLDIINSAVVTWFSNGDGTFSAPLFAYFQIPADASANGTLSFAIAVGDFNADGAPDVVVLTDRIYDVLVPYSYIFVQTFLNNAAGILAPLPAQQSTLNDLFTANIGQATVTRDAAGAPTGIAFALFDVGFNMNFNAGVDVLAITSHGDGTFSPVVAPATPLMVSEADRTYGSVFATNLTAKGSGNPTTDIVMVTGDKAVWDVPFTTGNPTTAKVLVGANVWPGLLAGTGNPTPTTLNGALDSNEQGLNVADMNGDGFQDLVVYQGYGIAIFPNDGTGNFTAAPSQVVGGNYVVTEPQPADYDGSGYNSLVALQWLPAAVGYYQNLGAGASVQAGQFRGATLPTGMDTQFNNELFGSNLELLAAGDINGDGIQDIVVENYAFPAGANGTAATQVEFGLSNGSGPGNQSSNFTFTPAFNGTYDNGKSWYGTDTHELHYVYPVSFKNPAGMLTFLAQGSSNGANAAFLIPVGKDGKSGQPQDLDLGPISLHCQFSYADIGDINGDGVTDIAIAYTGCGGQDYPSGVFTFLGNADGSFQTAQFTPLGTSLNALKLINFTGRPGYSDIAASNYDFSDPNPANPDYDLYVLPNKGDGSGTFDTTRVTIPLKHYLITDLVKGDYNGDGKQDLTALTFGEWQGPLQNYTPGTVGVVLLPGKGDYTFGPATLAAPGILALSGVYADFNGDGLPDLAITTGLVGLTSGSAYYGPDMFYMANQGGGAFGEPVAPFVSFGQPTVGSNVMLAGSFTTSGGPDIMANMTGESILLVNRGVTTLTLTASSTTPGQGVPVTFSATLNSAIGGGAAPTGAVSFTSNGTLIGSATPVNGVATLDGVQLPVGTDAIVASYAGDADHNPSTGQLSVTVAAVPPSFTLTSAMPSLSLAQGANGTVVVSIAGNSTFSGVVQLTCTGAPAEVSCTPSPASTTLTPGQSANASIVIATTPPNNSTQASNVVEGTLGGISLAGLAFLLWPGRCRLPRLLVMLAIAALGITSFGALSGCGGSGDKYPGTTAGSYTLTVTAVSGSITQTQSIALTVTKPVQ